MVLTVEATSIVLPLLEGSGEVLQTKDALNKMWLKSSLEVLSESTITQVCLSLEHLKVNDELLSRLRALVKEGELVTCSSLSVRITKYRLQLLDRIHLTAELLLPNVSTRARRIHDLKRP